jgi:para-aminobenzoate synthetase/4-amino-4-deoxychorismate lyase
VAVRVTAVPSAGGPLAVAVAAGPAPEPPLYSLARVVRDRGGLWRHKWADRRQLTRSEDGPGTPLFVAADGSVLETSRGNVFLLTAQGTLVTAPLRDDLLPGVTRRALLDLARDEGWPAEVRPFGVPQLLAAAAFWTSSLSLAVPIHRVDDVALPRRDEQIAAIAASLGRVAIKPLVS